jgi:hypothetical protein
MRGDAGQVLAPFQHQSRRAFQHCGTFLWGRMTPAGETARGGIQRPVEIGLRGERQVAEFHAGGRLTTGNVLRPPPVTRSPSIIMWSAGYWVMFILGLNFVLSDST